MKIDLKKLKKVSSDKNKTILQHPKGHQIVVAHKGLKKANLEALSKLPKMYKNPENVEENTPAYFPNFANGGEVLPEEADIFQAVGSKTRQKMMKPAEELADEEDMLTGDEVESLERGYGLQEAPIAQQEVEATPIAAQMPKEGKEASEKFQRFQQKRLKLKVGNRMVNPEELVDMVHKKKLVHSDGTPWTIQDLEKQFKKLSPEQQQQIKTEHLLEKQMIENPEQVMRGPASDQPVTEIKEPAIDVEKQAAKKAALEAQEASRKKFAIPKKSIEEINKIPVPAEQEAETNVGPVGPRSPHSVPTAPTIMPGGQLQYPQRVPQAAAPVSQQPVIQMPTLPITATPQPQAVQAPAPTTQEALPEEEEVAPTPTLPQVPTPPAVVPKQLPAGYKGDVFAPAYETKLKAAQVAEEAGQKKFEAEKGLAEQEFKTRDIFQSRLNMIAAEQQKALNDQIQERQKRLDDIQKNLIDPYRIIRNMSTGDKILSSIGLILGGMGAGLTHQPNLAYEIMKDAINKDVDAQVKNLGVRETMLSKDLEFYKDLQSAKKNVAGMYLDMTNQLLERAKTANLPYQKQAELMMMQAKLLDDISKTEQEIAQRQAFIKAQQAGGAEGMAGTTAMLRSMGPEGTKLAEDIESKYVPGFGKATVAVPPDIRLKMIKMRDLDEQLNDLVNFSKANSGSWRPDTIKKGKAKAELIRQTVREAFDMGVIKDSEVELMNRLIGDPTQVFAKFRSQQGYQEVIRNNRNKLDSFMRGYGFAKAPEAAAPAVKAPEAKAEEKLPPPPKGFIYMIAPDGKTIGTVPNKEENLKKAKQKGFKIYKGQ